MEVRIVDTPQKYWQMLRLLKDEPVLALDSETVGRTWLRARRWASNLIWSSLLQRTFKYKRAYNKAITRCDSDKSGLQFWNCHLGMLQIATESTAYLIRPACVNDWRPLGELLENVLVLVLHNARFDWKVLRATTAISLTCLNVHDTYIGERLITNGTGLACDLKSILQRRYSKAISKAKETRISNWLGEWSEAMIAYAVGDVSNLIRLKTDQRRELLELDLSDVYRLEQQILPLNAQMEMAGIGVDVENIAELKSALTREVEALAEKGELALGVSNLNSPTQVLASLQRVGIDVKSTDAKQLKKHAAHPIVQQLLEYRKVNKLLTTYFGVLGERSVQQHDGHYRIYAGFNPQGTDSGRWSSADPNFQNLPKQPEYRRFVVPSPGKVFVCADTSQIELRILAELAQEPALIKAFDEGRDVHKLAASLVYGIPEEAVTKDQRGNCKTVGFGIIYGQTAYGLSNALGVSEAAAQDLIDRYLRNFYQVKRWIERTKQQVIKDGYAKTLLGRIRFFPDVNSRNENKREHALRAAINHIIQGTAADALKESIVILCPLLDKHTTLIGCFHDELLLETLESQAKEIAALVKECIIKGYTKYIKRVRIEIGSVENNWEPLIIGNWGEAKG